MRGPTVNPTREGVSAAAESEGKAKRVPAGSLLMSFKLTIGRVAFAARDLFPNEAIAWLKVTDAALSERFLALWLTSQDLTGGSARAVKGATLNSDSLRAIRVPLPAREEQDLIVRLFDELDSHRQLLDSELRASNELKAEILARSFDRGRPGRVIAGRDAFLVEYGKALKASDRKPGSVKVFGAAGPVGRHDQALRGTAGIVVGRKGVDSRASLGCPIRRDESLPEDAYEGWGGAGAVRWAATPHWVIDTAFTVKPIAHELSADMAYWMLVHADLPRLATQTTLPGLSREAIYGLDFYWPDSFAESVEILEAFDDYEANLVVEISALSRYRSELLERIMAQQVDLSSDVLESLDRIA